MQNFSGPRHIWRAMYPILIFFAVSFVVVFLAEFFALVVYGFNSAASGQMDLGGILSGDMSSLEGALSGENPLSWIFNNIMWIQCASSAVTVAVLLPMWHFAKSKPAVYSGGWLDSKTVLLIIGAGIGANYLVSAVIGLLNLAELFPDYGEVETLLSGGSLTARVLAVGLVGPVAEEICVRGIVQKRLSEWIPMRYAVFFSALVFGVMHMNVLQGSYAFLFGILLSLIYIKFRTLWAPIIGHIAVNLSSVLLGELFENLVGIIPPWLDMLSVLLLIAVGVFCALAIIKLPDNVPDEDEVIKEKLGDLSGIVEVNALNREDVTNFIKRHWFSTTMLIRGKIIDMTKVDGFVIYGTDVNKRRVINGLVTFIISDGYGISYQSGRVCEIVSLNSTVPGRGLGTFLMDKVVAAAMEKGCRRIQLLTTNDNVGAIEFYQKYGFELAGINLGAVDRERELKPEIPLTAANGIPIKHEIEFAMELQKSYSHVEIIPTINHKEELQWQQS